MPTKLQILEQYFGYPSSRPGQEELIDALLAGRDAVGILPTGAVGKSLCYQVPALLLEGITLVVSPLISLMRDQVAALVQNGVRGAYLNSSLTWGQYQGALHNARAGVYKIIYVAPERLVTAGVPGFRQQRAHRHGGGGRGPLRLPVGAGLPAQLPDDPGVYRARCPARPVVAAFTATATHRGAGRYPRRCWSCGTPVRHVTGFDRPNLYFEVRRPRGQAAPSC